jgi:hypothetical protein
MHFLPEVLEDHHPYREIEVGEGRRLNFYANQDPEADAREVAWCPEMANEQANDAAVLTELLRRGVLEAPDVPAFDMAGNEMPDAWPLYVDARLGVSKVAAADKLIEAELRLMPPAEQTQRRVTPTELKAVIDDALEESGVLSGLEQMWQTGPHDLAELMRRYRDQLR